MVYIAESGRQKKSKPSAPLILTDLDWVWRTTGLTRDWTVEPVSSHHFFRRERGVRENSFFLFRCLQARFVGQKKTWLKNIDTDSLHVWEFMAPFFFVLDALPYWFVSMLPCGRPTIFVWPYKLPTIEDHVLCHATVVCVCVFFFPIHSGLQWTYQPGSHRKKVTQDFPSTFFLRCLP